MKKKNKHKYSCVKIALLVSVAALTLCDAGFLFWEKTQAAVDKQDNAIIQTNLELAQQLEQQNLFAPEKSPVANADPTPVSSVVAAVASKSAPPKAVSMPAIKRNLKCPYKTDSPSISTKNNVNHMDEDCCPDYDEWPKPNCIYSAGDYAVMLKGPTPGHITWAQVHAEHEAGIL